MSSLYVAFKGSGNSSNRIVSNLSGDKLFITNSYDGLKKDICSINKTYSLVYMFGLDKKLKGDVRIECAAIKNGERLHSDIDLDAVNLQLNKVGIAAKIGNSPMPSLCNEAYWHMLNKFNHHVVFFHVPSIRYITDDFIEKIKSVL